MSVVLNIAKGRTAYYTGVAQAGTGGANLKLIVLEATGLVADATMADYVDVATLLAGTTNEQTTMGRKTLSTPTATIDNGGDVVNLDAADATWTAATGNGVGALLIAFDPTGSSADSALIPISKHDWALTPDGSDATVTISNFIVCS